MERRNEREKKQENESPSGCGFRWVSHHGNVFSECKFGFDQIVVNVCMGLRDGVRLCRKVGQNEKPERIYFCLIHWIITCSSDSDLIYKKKNQAYDGSKTFMLLESITSSLPRLELKFGNWCVSKNKSQSPPGQKILALIKVLNK